MVVKIVTDSSADLPARFIQELGITVVPLYVRFGEQVYRDRVDITEDEFYQRLIKDTVHPSTTQPSPQDFATVYKNLAKEADGIVSLHISAKLSGTCNSALQAKNEVKECPIEVIDSQILTMALGLVVISAAKLANTGAKFEDVVSHVRKVLPTIKLLGLLDTLKFLLLGGRIGKAKALLGSLLNVKPVLTLKDGEVVPAGQVRSRSKGMDRLFEFVKTGNRIEELSVIHNTTPEEAETLANRIVNANIISREKLIISRVGPMLGVHMGPGALIVTYKESEPSD